MHNRINKLKPKLRFIEFGSIWIENVLGNIAIFKKGKSISKADIVEDGSLECIRYGELYTHYKEIIKDIKSKTNLEPNHLVLSESNDVIIPASGETQIDIATASCVLKDGVALGGDLNIIKTKENGVFLSYYLNSKRKIDIARLSQGISVVHLYSSQLKTLKLNLPKEKEQHKIATFLTSVDTKIQQLTTKKQLLENYKKGVMQQLFSQQLRFKPDVIANDSEAISNSKNVQTSFPDWEEKRLGEVAEIIGGGTPDTTNNDYWDGDIQWFTPTEIRSKFISNSKRTISQSGLKKSSAKLLPSGTILFTSRATIAELGFATQECSTNQGFQSLVVNKNNNSEFVYYLIKFFKKEFIRKSQGSTFLEISSKEMKKIKFKIPSLKEQQKIATYLSAIDKKIENVQTQIEKTQAFKKGLLQQLFV